MEVHLELSIYLNSMKHKDDDNKSNTVINLYFIKTEVIIFF